MNTNVINTQRFADRMKEAGVEDGPAVAMSQALNSELANVATKDDLGRFATKEDFGKLATKDELAKFATKDDLAHVAANLATREDLARVNGRIDALDAKVNGRVDVLKAKVDALGDQISAHGRNLYLIAALLVALGLYNVVAPHFPPREPPSVAVESTQAAAEAPDAPDPADDDRPPTQATANSPR